VRLATILLLAGLTGCGEDRECTYDTNCPIGERCVATRCVSIQLAPTRDAGPGTDAGPGRDAAVVDSGPELDAGPDATVNPECALSMVPPGGVVVGSTQSTADAPLIARVGANLFTVAVRAPGGIVAQYIGDDGSNVVGPFGPLNGTPAQPDLGLATGATGAMLVWREGDDRLHGAFVTDVEAQDLGFLTEVATATSSPSAAATADGFVVAWSDRGDGTDRVSTRTLDRSGVPTDDAVRYATPGAARLPRIADDIGEGYPLVWSDGRDGASHPYFGIRYADGSIGGERALSETEVVGGVDVVATPFGAFASWIGAPAQKGGLGSVHVTRLEGDDLTDRAIANASGLDGRTSITWDGDRVLVGWHRGADVDAEITVAAVRPDLTTASSLVLGAGTARPTLDADEVLRGMVWIDTASSDVRYGELSCD